MTRQVESQKEYLDAQHELFRYEYEMRYPPPKTDTSAQRNSMKIILIASILVSAYHTIPFFIGDAPQDTFGLVIRVGLSLCIVGMLEWGLVKVGEFLIEYLNTDTIQTLRPILLFIALALLLFVAIFANILDVMSNRNMYIVEWLTTLVTVIAGLTAPVMALITGVIFASLELKVTEDMAEWQRQFNREWSRFKKVNDVNVTVQEPTIIPNILPNGTPMELEVPQIPNSNSNWNPNGNSGSNYSRKSNAMESALDFYRSNPHMLDANPATLQEQAGAKKSTLYKARELVRQELEGES